MYSLLAAVVKLMYKTHILIIPNWVTRIPQLYEWTNLWISAWLLTAMINIKIIWGSLQLKYETLKMLSSSRRDLDAIWTLGWTSCGLLGFWSFVHFWQEWFIIKCKDKWIKAIVKLEWKSRLHMTGNMPSSEANLSIAIRNNICHANIWRALWHRWERSWMELIRNAPS
jgi:hypothetical protein